MSTEISPEMHAFLHELPKCEHHVHLEGTLGPELLFPLAKRNNIELPKDFPTTVEELQYKYDNFKDLQDFLDLYYVGMGVLITEEDFYELAWAYFTKAHADGLHHAETFFDPQGHLERGISMETVVNGFKKACDQAEKELGITTKLIMCLLRHLPAKDGLDTIQLAKPYYQKGWIHGLGLDSSEKPFPPELFEECYAHMAEHHPEVLLTAHAGEEGGPEFIHKSLDLLNVTRIDHGVNSIKDPLLIKKLAEQQTMLSLCPMSNLKLRVVEDIGDLPIREWIAAGVPFSINSDDPAYFGGYILDNYLAVQDKFGFDIPTWKLIAQNGVNGSFVAKARKDELLRLIDEVCAKHQ
ncbi:hypothetical protein OGAPHI_005494 [Ogataea philodendri]|uniref:Adenine deaminase n=1 Tax=Ogataea philodendri TaxID=1378263 RepID=A0A9P8NZR0_9ASCO|nr:uncharacterized protein OGAPHI_005494 [Ogataea philodendri]KAH3662246.1 hypothetical protein OGAPHI_005494 [Ogataea philodendri]